LYHCYLALSLSCIYTLLCIVITFLTCVVYVNKTVQSTSVWRVPIALYVANSSATSKNLVSRGWPILRLSRCVCSKWLHHQSVACHQHVHAPFDSSGHLVDDRSINHSPFCPLVPFIQSSLGLRLSRRLLALSCRPQSPIATSLLLPHERRRRWLLSRNEELRARRCTRKWYVPV
jgi:hypothetical protein